MTKMQVARRLKTLPGRYPMTQNQMIKRYKTKFVRKGERHGKTVYDGPSLAKARNAAAYALGYGDIRSAYEYTATTQDGEEGVFYCRRKEAHRDDFDVAIITRADEGKPVLELV